MKNEAYAIIMAGGKGERFWPLSTAKCPKQLVSLFGGKPLLTQAVERLAGVIPPEHVFVITNADLVKASRAAIPQVPPGNVIGEPFGRDTAAACALGMALVRARDPHGVMCVVTADHIMKDLPQFRRTLREGMAIVRRQPLLATIGIVPTYPSTGYGYIEADTPLRHAGTVVFRKARRFVEKPDQKTAEGYIKTGRYFWNAGMFIWSVATFSAALAKHRPQLLALCDNLAPAIGTRRFAAALRTEYGKLDRISVDYAIMEKADNIITAEGTFRWYDVGSWPALVDHFPADPAGNVLLGQCEAVESGGNIVLGKDRLVALLGVQDLVVVQTGKVTLICPKHKAQDVKKMVQWLGQRGGYQDVL